MYILFLSRLAYKKEYFLFIESIKKEAMAASFLESVIVVRSN